MFAPAPQQMLPPQQQQQQPQQGMMAPAEPEALRNLIINYIPTSVDEMQLRQLFQMYGPIEQAKIIFDRETRQSKGYGFVKFRFAQSALGAIQYLNGYSWHNKRLKVAYANAAEAQKAGQAMDPQQAQLQMMQQQQQMAAMQQHQGMMMAQQAQQAQQYQQMQPQQYQPQQQMQPQPVAQVASQQ